MVQHSITFLPIHDRKETKSTFVVKTITEQKSIEGFICVYPNRTERYGVKTLKK